MAITPSIAFIPSGYKDGLIYSKLPINGQADLNFSRSSSARRFTKEGLLEEVSGNTPRLNWEQSNNPYLLIEDASTNIVKYSEDFARYDWNKSNIDVTSNEAIAPDGSKSADKIKRTSASASYINDAFNKSSSSVVNMSGSFFVKKGLGDYGAIRITGSFPARVDLQFRYSTSEVFLVTSTTFTVTNYSIKEVKNGFFRVSISCETDNNSTATLAFSPRDSEGKIDSSDINSNAYAYLWGAQLEENNYSSSYIPNFGTSSGVTRLKESFSKSGLSEYLDGREGVIFADIAFNSSKSKNIVNSISIQDSLGNSNNLIGLFQNQTKDSISVYIRQSNSTLVNVSYDLVDATEFNKVALWYKSGSTKLFINGSIAPTSSVGGSTEITAIFNDFSLSVIKNFFNNDSNFKLRDLRFYKSGEITEEFLNKLTR